MAIRCIFIRMFVLLFWGLSRLSLLFCCAVFLLFRLVRFFLFQYKIDNISFPTLSLVTEVPVAISARGIVWSVVCVCEVGRAQKRYLIIFTLKAKESGRRSSWLVDGS